MKITVPVSIGTLGRCDKQTLLTRLEQLGADEVYIVFLRSGFNPYRDTDRALEIIKKYGRFLNENGYRTALWLTALSGSEQHDYQYMVGINGEPSSPLVCPFDDRYTADFCGLLKEFVRAGMKTIVLDDDFRMQLCGSEISCFCDKHMEFYSRCIGEEVTREKMKEMLLCQGPNRYREAWMAGCRAALEKMASAVRSALDEEDESVRIVLCCGPALFGADGTEPYTLAEIFAGKNHEKELRLIGAPYWEKMFHDNMLSAIDFARHQAYECKKRGILTIGEGDSFPRPRYAVSAAKMEFYHTITLADGNFDRLLKYGLDYMSDFDYESGYADRAQENKPLYREIEKMFSDKICVGFHLVEPFDRIRYEHTLAEYPEMNIILSSSRNYLNDLSLPSVFEPGGVNVMFGENARHFDRAILKNGTILDMDAALILQELGIDTGIKEVVRTDEKECRTEELAHLTESFFEYYPEEEDNALLTAEPHCCHGLVLKESAKPASWIHINEDVVVGSYTYENQEGEKFLVYNFVMDKDGGIQGLIRNYYRQRQVIRLYSWLNGKKLEAICPGNPDLYLMVKRGKASLAVGLWNYFEDKITKPVIYLHKTYKNIRFLNCDGVLEGDRITLTSGLGAYDFAFAEVWD